MAAALCPHRRCGSGADRSRVERRIAFSGIDAAIVRGACHLAPASLMIVRGLRADRCWFGEETCHR